MKTSKTILLTGAAAFALSVGPRLQAQDAQSVRSTDADRNITVQTERRDVTDRSLNTTTITDQATTVGKVNKASSLVGMDVRNTQNEKLGEIKDIVLDLHSGKVAYAVLSVGGFLGIGDKYVAVPPSAFTAAPDQDKLILNADKAKIQNAPGFAKSSWPDLNSSTWTTESAYWLTDGTAQGTAATIRSGTGGTTSTTTDRQLDQNVTRDAIDTTPGQTTTSARDRLERATSTDRDQFRGQITAIDPQNRTMTVEGPSGTRQFKFTESPAITLKDSRNPHLSDLKVGFPVVVGYHEENGQFVAHSVIRTEAPEVR